MVVDVQIAVEVQIAMEVLVTEEEKADKIMEGGALEEEEREEEAQLSDQPLVKKI